MPIFAVDNLDKRTQLLKDMDGSCLAPMDETRNLCSDPQGGSFIIQQASQVNHKPDRVQKTEITKNDVKAKRVFKWKTMLALIAIWFAVFSDATWLWGILFLLWILPDLRRRETFFVEHLSARDNPILYWALMLSWIVFAVYMITSSLF